MPTSAETKLSLVDRWYRAYDQRDVEEMVRIAHGDFAFVPSQPLLERLPGARFHGHAGLRGLMRWSYETYPRVRASSWTAELVGPGAAATVKFVVDDRPQPPAKREIGALFDFEDGLIRRIRTFGHLRAARAAARDGSLTTREREIFQLLARGYTAPQIADLLVLSPGTVRTHVRNGIGRLGAKTRVQAVSIALARGEIDG